MTREIYPIVLQLVRRLSPYLPVLRARSTSLGWVSPLEPELGALFHRVIGTLVRLVEPRR